MPDSSTAGISSRFGKPLPPEYWRSYYVRKTLAETIRQRASSSAGDTFLAFESKTQSARISLMDAAEQAGRYAFAFKKLGVGSGDVIAVQLPSCTEAVVLCQAVWLLGGILLPVSANCSVDDIAYLIQDSGAKALVMPGVSRDRNYCDDLEQLMPIPCLQVVVVVDSTSPIGTVSWPAFHGLAVSEVNTPPKAQPDDLAAIFYTPGTGAKPKGVKHSHNSLIFEATAGQAFLGLHRHGNQLFPWDFGSVACLISYIRWWVDGANTVLSDCVDPHFVAELVAKYRIVTTACEPHYLSSLLDEFESTGLDLTSLKNVRLSDGFIPSALAERCNQQGINIYRVYGSTEHPSICAGLLSDVLTKRVFTDGRALPGSQVRIVDDEYCDVPIGASGEIAVIGPDQCLGYLNFRHNKDAYLAGGWHLTGDVGWLDRDGYLTIIDRKQDVIIRDGERISSREVEQTLNQHPSVVECVALAQPSLEVGESVCVVVVLVEGHTLNLAQITEHFSISGLAQPKIPTLLKFTDALPRNAMGKVLKQALREVFVSPVALVGAL